MPKLFSTALLLLGFIAPSARGTVCSTAVAEFTTPEALAEAIRTANHLSIPVRRALTAVNKSLAASANSRWKEFAGDLRGYLYPEVKLETTVRSTVARLASQPSMSGFFLKQCETFFSDALYQPALTEIGAAMVCVSYSSLKENPTYVDRFFESAISYLWQESDGGEWLGAFERLVSQTTHYR